jgi:Tol biopolymer transport system component
MALASGAHVGSYEILSSLGAGGMGEVYRARDRKLDRTVAIKILPEGFANDPERIARFEREAKTLAALNHPNIAHLYGLEDSAGLRALVMELVEGPTLADRIAQGPIPINEALPIARQIAEALEAAHEQGIIHRDLKPANIKITADSKVKVLDFGLAKAMDPAATGANLANSPTLTMEATQAGIILGTAAYMSPEQARGTVVDKRTDLWSLGAVLYEMLTGRRLFEAATVPDTLSQVLMKEPDWNVLPVSTPAPIRRLLRRCLEKDRKQRLDSAAAVRLEIDEPQLTPTQEIASAPARAVSAPHRRPMSGWLVAAAGLLAPLALALAVLTYLREQPPRALERMRFHITPPEHVTLSRVGGFAVSPDGRHLVFAATGSDGTTRLWLRSLEAIEARPLPGTEGSTGTSPFWSPDSRFVAFNAAGKLKRIDIAGGPAQTLCDAPTVLGGSWNRDGIIIFTQYPGPLMRVSAAGGEPTPVTSLDSAKQEGTHAFPTFLPDGRHFLHLRVSTSEATGIYVGSLDNKPDNQNAKRVVATFFESAYVPSESNGRGQLLFRREGTLVAQPFDTLKMELTGEPIPVAERLGSALANGFFSASATGVLVFRTGLESLTSQLTWVDREGKTLGTVGDVGLFLNVALSPDGSRAAFSRFNVERVAADIWVLDIRAGTDSRFTFGPNGSTAPVWSPDGSRIVFGSGRAGMADLYQKPANGTTDEEVLLESADEKTPTSWSGDGRFLLYTAADPKTKADLWALPLGGGRTPIPVLRTGFNEDQGRFSPDARWIAYRSDESGRNEIYVRGFSPSGSGAKVLVSKGGGSSPRWRRDGRELLYTAFDGTITAVDVTVSTEFRVGTAKPLSKLPAIMPLGTGALTTTWDVTADGSRFLVAVPVEQRTQTPFTVVLNWQEELNKRRPTK